MTDSTDDGPNSDTTASPESRTDGGQTAEPVESAEQGLPLGIPTAVGVLLPLVLLGGVIAGFVVFNPFAGLQTGGPLPDLTITHTSLPNTDTIILHVTNNGPQSLTIEQVLVNDAYWNFQLFAGGAETTTLAPMQSGRVVIPYHWTPGWDLGTALVLDNGATFHHGIVAPQPEPGVTFDMLKTLAVVGVFVAVIPVALGMLWYPYMKRLSQRWLHAVLLFSVGVLSFLAFDAGFEAFDVAAEIPGAFEGTLLVVLGIVGAFLLVQAVSAWAANRDGAGEGGTLSGLGLAYMIALGIGLHNLAEGLAIGSSFALGRVSLGAFLVMGFMIHNVTEGPAVVAPLAEGRRPSLAHFAGIGLLAGAPIILGGWIGGFAFDPTVGALFLALGVGAILQVDWEIASMVRREGRLGSATNLLGFLVGFVVMYATDLLIAL